MRISSAVCWIATLGMAARAICGAELIALEKEFVSPPDESKPWCYWWWLNGNASKEGITRDFEEMRKQGISGALLFDAGEAASVARGPAFMSTEWRELFKHAVREANRCGIVLTVNLCSGWNAGGPWVTPEHAAKMLVCTQSVVNGPGRVCVALPKPATAQDFYQDIAVLAAPIPDNAASGGKITASSQYQHYGPALAEDGDDETRWVSNGGKPGMGPTPEKPEFLQFDFAAPRAAAGLYLKPYPDCAPKDVLGRRADVSPAQASYAQAARCCNHRFRRNARGTFSRCVSDVASLPGWELECAGRRDRAAGEGAGTAPVRVGSQPVGSQPRGRGNEIHAVKRAAGMGPAYARKLESSAHRLHAAPARWSCHQVRRLRPRRPGDRYDEHGGDGRPFR
jgi:hypothetical protein